MNQTSLQFRVGDDVRGRVLSIYPMWWGMLPLGQIVVGAIAAQAGAPLTVALSCTAALLVIAYIAHRFPMLRA